MKLWEKIFLVVGISVVAMIFGDLMTVWLWDNTDVTKLQHKGANHDGVYLLLLITTAVASLTVAAISRCKHCALATFLVTSTGFLAVGHAVFHIW